MIAFDLDSLYVLLDKEAKKRRRLDRIWFQS
jgi:hypothetical protein